MIGGIGGLPLMSPHARQCPAHGARCKRHLSRLQGSRSRGAQQARAGHLLRVLKDKRAIGAPVLCVAMGLLWVQSSRRISKAVELGARPSGRLRTDGRARSARLIYS